MKKTPLTCEIARGELIIRIGVETLAFAVNNGVAIAGCKVTDAADFAQFYKRAEHRVKRHVNEARGRAHGIAFRDAVKDLRLFFGR